MSELQLENSTQRLTHIHDPYNCSGRPCTIHNKTSHPLRSWPQYFNFSLGYMERTCEHGVGHPDPDEYKQPSVHSCDGCCSVLAAEVPEGLKPLQATMEAVQRLTGEAQEASKAVVTLFARGEVASPAFADAMVTFFKVKAALEAELAEFQRLTS